jgi:uncharacterized protein (TIGR00251 family)
VTNTRIAVRLTPRGGRDAIDGWDGDVLRARVAAPAAEGRANDALVRLLARALGVAPSNVQMIAGRQSRVKMFEIEGVSEHVARVRLAGNDRKGA